MDPHTPWSPHCREEVACRLDRTTEQTCLSAVPAGQPVCCGAGIQFYKNGVVALAEGSSVKVQGWTLGDSGGTDQITPRAGIPFWVLCAQAQAGGRDSP